MNTSIWIVLLTGLSGLLSILLTQSYTKNAGLRADLKNKKQALYSGYVKFLYDTYSGSNKLDNENIVETLKNYFPKILTFASNEVVKCTGDYMQHLYKYDQSQADAGDTSWNINSMEYFGDLILAIRKDLGHKKFGQIMRWHDVARIWITDIDTYIPKTEQTPRGTHNGPRIEIKSGGKAK